MRVPGSMLVGDENEGWKLITTQLNHERVALMPLGMARTRPARGLRRWASATRAADGRRVIDQEWVQANLARVRASSRC